MMKCHTAHLFIVSLEAELEAELEARRRQYAYYRDKLLGFDREREFLG